MKPYSKDLREKIVTAVEAKERSQKEVAALFGVSKSFVEKLMQRWRTTGQCGALPHRGGRTRELAHYEKELWAEVAAQPDLTLAELRERLEQKGAKRVSLATLCTELQRLRLVRKKRVSMPRNVTVRESKRSALTTRKG
jgi:transposase